MINKVILNEYDLYKTNMSIPEVSQETGIAKSTLYFRFKAAGILRSRSEGIRQAAEKGKLGSGNRGKHRIFSEEWKRNLKKALVESGEKRAKGISLKPNGYIEITRGEHKGRSEHVVIMENSIGRKINRGESVHHINGIKADNRIENLRLLSVNEHSHIHGKINYQLRNRNDNGQFAGGAING